MALMNKQPCGHKQGPAVYQSRSIIHAFGQRFTWRVTKGARPEFARRAADPSATSYLQELSGKVILVAGANGGVGKQVVNALSTYNGVTIRALVRDMEKASSLAGVSAGTTEVIKGDVYQFATLPAAMAGCDAIVCCTGARDARDPLGPFTVDYQGTLNLIAAARQKGVKQFILVTSIGADDLVNPLNLFWGVLFWKKRAEEELQRSGLTYTIVRPGGLKNEVKQGETKGNIIMAAAGTYGVPPLKQSGSILRSQVAEVCVASLVEPAAANKVVEVIAETNAPTNSMSQLFESVAF